MFVLIHLVVGSVRGFYRHQMIERYQYNYYSDPPMNLLSKLAHNWLNGTFSLTTLLISASLTILLFIIFNA
ncbi:hypothetical protein DKG77_04055 [Flagellimonas aquimarina]|uniref:Uncharacterized protein n=1 Tax=Flagellimonas aquimarina TaxID=2201895 RepID=A0A316L3L3_9FLAO|nr:hypothetical protein [Allomuricauda koreensis]PWL40008.1 hypothetical protein DKG77_04055 [Allomuricauda koreensis]